MKALLIIVALALCCGCATDREAEVQHLTQSIRWGEFLLSTNAEPSSFYELGVYAVDKGDTIAKIAGQFKVSTQELIAINPGLVPTRLVIGQNLRVYERIAPKKFEFPLLSAERAVAVDWRDAEVVGMMNDVTREQLGRLIGRVELISPKVIRVEFWRDGVAGAAEVTVPGAVVYCTRDFDGTWGIVTVGIRNP